LIIIESAELFLVNSYNKVRDRTMQITIRGHHLTITPAIEDDIRCKFKDMTKHLDRVNSMQVKLSKDHQIDKRSKKGSLNHIAEAIIRLPGIELFAQASADDMYTSVKILAEKLKRQLDKYRKMQLIYQPLMI
jgi:putative sigma-54 modulation protein